MAKRKKYEEYRSFQEEWTEEFAFVERAGSAVCHANFASKYPAGDSRKKACQELLSRVQASQQQLRVWTRQGDYNSASFAGSLAIVRNGKPFTDGEYAKTFMLDVGNELFDDFTNKDKIIKRIQDMPLSATTVHDRTIMMANQVEETQVKDINAAPFFSLALDESTDVSHLSQFSVITRYAAGDTLREESLAVLPLKGSTTVVQGQDGWAVTYTPTEICALRGSTVVMRCNYTYPSSMNGLKTPVEEATWFVNMNRNEPLDLTTDPQYPGRVNLLCGDNNCTLRITDLRESDSAEYKFMFKLSQHKRHIGSPGVTLSVTAHLDVQVKVSRSGVSQSSNSAELKCHSRCPPPERLHYIWYKNGQKIEGQTFRLYSVSSGPADSFSCAVEGYEAFRSPPVYGKDLMGPSTTTRVTTAGMLAAAGTIPVVLLAVISLSVYLWIRKKRTSNESCEAEERPDNREQEEQGELQYSSIHFSNNQADPPPLYSNHSPAGLPRHMEQQEVSEYAAVRFNSGSTAPRTRGQQTGQDPAKT